MMDERIEALWLVAACLMVALLAAPVLRGAAVEVSRTLGQVYPFALQHCRSADTPGCRSPAVRQAASNIRANQWRP